MAKATPGDGEPMFVVSTVPKVQFTGGLLRVSLLDINGATQTIVMSTSLAVEGVNRVQQALLGGKVVPWVASKRAEGH